jgi:phosphoribosylaminoimidazole-succinocarboxamide synthase
MEIARDIGIPIAMLDSPDPNVIVQQRMENSGFECIVRAFVWGSLASDYEDGLRQKSGIPLPNGLIRYQRLDEPIFTPSTKAGIGHHDQDITLEDMIKVLGPENAMKIKGYSISLFREGAFRARAKGKHLIDTKFEFGFDKEKGLWLIDESLSPDSSRYCSKAEYDEKFPKIVEAMRTGNYKDVSALLKERPELKIREDSKQFVRDVLIEGGYKEGSIPDLTDEQIIETAWRYIDTYEKLTGKTFDFAQSDLPTAEKRVMNNLKKAGMVYGGCVVPMLASEKDMPHWEKLEKELKGAGVPFVKPFFGSAHKETLRVLEYIGKMDQSIEPLVFITSAGRSDGLGPTVAANTRYPTIACNPYSDIATYMVDIHSSTRMPSNLPLMVVVEPGNAALAAKRMIDLAK